MNSHLTLAPFLEHAALDATRTTTAIHVALFELIDGRIEPRQAIQGLLEAQNQLSELIATVRRIVA